MDYVWLGILGLVVLGFVAVKMLDNVPAEDRRRRQNYDRLKSEWLTAFGHRWRQPTDAEWRVFEKRAAEILDSDDPGQKYWP